MLKCELAALPVLSHERKSLGRIFFSCASWVEGLCGVSSAFFCLILSDICGINDMKYQILEVFQLNI